MTGGDGLVWLRNSADPAVVLSFTRQEWQIFRSAMAAGEFDDLDAAPEA